MADFPIRTALISVSDKTGVADFARALTERGVEILSTGGTLAHLRDHNIPATSIADYTGQPEILGGRVKTLHPKIFASILARRDNPEDMRTLEEQGIKPIDLVAVNLYPFRETVSNPEVTFAEAIEQIDIGGVSLIRAAAKNYASVTVITSPRSYQFALDVIGAPSDKRAELNASAAFSAFLTTRYYDEAIALYLAKASDEREGLNQFGLFPLTLDVSAERSQGLRYGENPHQKASFYALDPYKSLDDTDGTSIVFSNQLQGKELSYNNILDADAALEITRVFPESPACVVVKHNNPCGVARADTLVEAFKAARDCDPTSAFGGIVGLNREVDGETATEMAELFLEAIVAPAFSPEARTALEKKKNLRLLETGPFTPPQPQLMLRSVIGGLLVQERDLALVTRDQLKIVTQLKPTDEDLDGLLFAWRVAKFTKSNAIVYTSRNATIGIGAGQMSRIDSTNIAAVKARRPIRGAYAASDAFFPFRDNVDRMADIGIRAIIQPGGSVRDNEVIAAADEHKIIMVLTGMRHFRH